MACLIALVLCLLPVSAGAGTLTLESRTIPGLVPKAAIVSHTLRLTGMIEAGDASRLQEMLARLKARTPPSDDGPLATIELSSIGGDLLIGIDLGYLLREYVVATRVRKGDRCLSACAFAFLGGTTRQADSLLPSRTIEIGGHVAFHNFTLDVATVEKEMRSDTDVGIARTFGLARTGAARLMRYTTDMGVAGTFIAALVGRPPDRWQYVDTDREFLGVAACPAGLLLSPGRLEQQAANICNHATNWRAPARASDARAISTMQARTHLLQHIEQNLVAFKVSGPLARQLAAVIASRDSRLVENVYADLRAAGVPMPVLSGPTFEVEGPVAGAFQVHCVVSLSYGDPNVFDLVLITRNGLSRALNQPPANCPLLFRYDPDDALNPQP